MWGTSLRVPWSLGETLSPPSLLTWTFICIQPIREERCVAPPNQNSWNLNLTTMIIMYVCIVLS